MTFVSLLWVQRSRSEPRKDLLGDWRPVTGMPPETHKARAGGPGPGGSIRRPNAPARTHVCGFLSASFLFLLSTPAAALKEAVFFKQLQSFLSPKRDLKITHFLRVHFPVSPQPFHNLVPYGCGCGTRSQDPCHDGRAGAEPRRWAPTAEFALGFK